MYVLLHQRVTWNYLSNTVWYSVTNKQRHRIITYQYQSRTNIMRTADKSSREIEFRRYFYTTYRNKIMLVNSTSMCIPILFVLLLNIKIASSNISFYTPHVSGKLWHMSHGITLLATPKNGHNYYLLFEQPSSRHSHATSCLSYSLCSSPQTSAPLPSPLAATLTNWQGQPFFTWQATRKFWHKFLCQNSTFG